jgi:hypothetical protein
MSRRIKHLSETTTLIFGHDVALGLFIDLIDNRYKDDPSGEGYVMEWNEKFGFTNNKINLTLRQVEKIDLVDMVKTYLVVSSKIEKFISKNNLKPTS